jgi:uncharacterized phage protein gp47/JayE
MARNFLTIVQAFKDFIRNVNSKAELSEGTFTKDIVIDAPAKEFELLYTRIDQVSNEQSISTASEVGLEKTLLNFSKVVKGARRSRTTVRFFKNQAPTANITIPAGTLVSTPLSDTATSVQFRTVQSVTMLSSLALSYLNSSTGKYEIAVEVEAVNGGTSGNVGAGTISILNGSISGIDGVYNPFTATGGQDKETSSDIRARLSTALSGTALGSKSGFQSFVLEQDFVEDVLVIGRGNTGRSEIGAVDIYIKGKLYRNAKDEFSDPFGPYPDFIFSKQPVIAASVTSVLSSANGALPVSAWTVSKDVGNYRGSIVAQDKLHWLTSVPLSSGSIIVNYQYNGLIEDLQSLLGKDNQDVINSNTLIKWATEIPINVTVSIRIQQGFVGSDVVSLVSSAINSFLTNLGIGQEIQQADIAREILNVSGVDDVLLPFTVFQSQDGSIIKNAFNNLTIPQTGYGSAGTIVVNIF